MEIAKRHILKKYFHIIERRKIPYDQFQGVDGRKGRGGYADLLFPCRFGEQLPWRRNHQRFTVKAILVKHKFLLEKFRFFYVFDQKLRTFFPQRVGPSGSVENAGMIVGRIPALNAESPDQNIFRNPNMTEF